MLCLTNLVRTSWHALSRGWPQIFTMLWSFESAWDTPRVGRTEGLEGVVFLSFLKKLYFTSRVQEWNTECEILWVKLQPTGSVPLHLTVYYKPNESDIHSSEEFKKSVQLLRHVKGHVWILGDFSYPKFTWIDCTQVISPDCKKYTCQYEDFSDLLIEFNLTQIVTHPSRKWEILNLSLTDNPTLVKSVELRLYSVNHNAVLSEIFIKPQMSRQKPRLMYLKKADWEGLETHMFTFQKFLLASCESYAIDSLRDSQGGFQEGLTKRYRTVCSPTVNQYKSRPFPGSHKKLKGSSVNGTVCMTPYRQTSKSWIQTPSQWET